MSVKYFKNKYEMQKKSIAQIVKKWQAEKAAKDFLGTRVYGSVVLGDLVTGRNFFDIDKVPDDIVIAMKDVFKNKVHDQESATAFLVEKTLNGDASVMGTVSAIQGRLGEYKFKDGFGDYAELAKDPTQQHFDVKITLPDEPIHYVQVKVYKDAGAAFQELKELNETLINGYALDGAKEIKNISFAVNDDLVDKLSAKAAELNSSIKVIP